MSRLVRECEIRIKQKGSSDFSANKKKIHTQKFKMLLQLLYISPRLGFSKGFLTTFFSCFKFSWASDSYVQVFFLMVSISGRYLHLQKTFWCHWHHGVKLHNIIDTAESDSTVSMTPLSQVLCNFSQILSYSVIEYLCKIITIKKYFNTSIRGQKG